MYDDLGAPVQPGLVRVPVVRHGVVAAVCLGLHIVGRYAPAVHILKHHLGPSPGQGIVVLIIAYVIRIPLDLDGKTGRFAAQVVYHLVYR